MLCILNLDPMRFLNTGFKTFSLKRIDAKWAKNFFTVSLGQTTPRFFQETNGVVFNMGGFLLAKTWKGD